MKRAYRDGGPAAIPLSAELWRDIPGYEGAYQASTLGRIRSLPRYVPVVDRVRGISYSRPCPGAILRQSVCDRAGHVSVHLGKHCRGIPVHQLVMLAFYGFPPAGMEAMHLNGNPTDNRPENLKYGSHSENMTDMYRMGKGPLKLLLEEVCQIRFGLSCGWSLRELAAAYGVSKTCICSIRKGRRYKWVEDLSESPIRVTGIRNLNRRDCPQDRSLVSIDLSPDEISRTAGHQAFDHVQPSKARSDSERGFGNGDRRREANRYG